MKDIYKNFYNEVEKWYKSYIYKSKDKSDFYLNQGFTDFLLKNFCNSEHPINTSDTIDNNKRIIYRGTKEFIRTYLKQLKKGVYKFHRYGAYGYGNYFSFKQGTALDYAEWDFNCLISANLEDDAKIECYMNIENYIDSFLCELEENGDKFDKQVVEFLCRFRKDKVMLTTFANLENIDAISNVNQDYPSVVCVVNPKKVTYLDKSFMPEKI